MNYRCLNESRVSAPKLNHKCEGASRDDFACTSCHDELIGSSGIVVAYVDVTLIADSAAEQNLVHVVQVVLNFLVVTHHR